MVEVMFDQLSVMFKKPAPPRPAPRKLTVWFRLANQQSGARAAVNGKMYSGKNCQIKIPKKIHQNPFTSADVPRLDEGRDAPSSVELPA